MQNSLPFSLNLLCSLQIIWRSIFRLRFCVSMCVCFTGRWSFRCIISGFMEWCCLIIVPPWLCGCWWSCCNWNRQHSAYTIVLISVNFRTEIRCGNSNRFAVDDVLWHFAAEFVFDRKRTQQFILPQTTTYMVMVLLSLLMPSSPMVVSKRCVWLSYDFPVNRVPAVCTVAQWLSYMLVHIELIPHNMQALASQAATNYRSASVDRCTVLANRLTTSSLAAHVMHFQTVVWATWYSGNRKIRTKYQMRIIYI